ncbi:MAG: TrkH family potassium uptake protein [Gammaproteobacteria bacterium]|nr:TrkH family potassium uptake protein [Gammaproteobacteria bacterium]
MWQAARPGAVLHYLGRLALVLGLATLVLPGAALLLGDRSLVAPYALLAGGLLGVGALARRWPAPPTLRRHEALVITALAFVLAPLVLALPFLRAGLGGVDAVFEAVSGVTTTGLSTAGPLAGRPPTFLFARAWMQWLGGLGFVVFSLALLHTPAAAARQLGAPGVESGDVAASVRAHARRVLGAYVALSVLGIGLLCALGAGFFDAVVHALAAVSTGGFAPRDDSLASLGPRLASGVLGLSLCGAIALPVQVGLWRGRWRSLGEDPESRALVIAIALVASWLLVCSDAGQGVIDLVLLAVSAQSTAGFSTSDPAALPAAGKAALILSMLSGGAQGSTAGGIKLLRVLMLLRLVQWLVEQTRLPSHAVSSPRFGGSALDADELLRAGAVVGLFLVVVALSWLAFLACGYAPLDALFEVVSATGTVGLSVGIARPELEPLLKGVLCADMYLGRLEIFALLVALAPRTWLGRGGS